MKKSKFFAYCLGLSLCVMLAAPTVFAGLSIPQEVAGGKSGGLPTNISLLEMIGRIINILLGLLGLVLFIYILYGGYLYMTSGGEEKKTGEAKKKMMYAIIGIIIILASYAIANFVIGKLNETMN